MNEVIPLQTQFTANDPDSGKPLVVVGVDFSSAFGPKLVVLRTEDGYTWPDLIEQVKRPAPTSRA
ncbi:hypothetical protein FZ934_07870 [Rhizobium grahamii]|uniref:Uncharacterized protein n=1 Tax=Rhizobium grahamii TaxID=1120045 RepID=A0A5Q0C390_9HYPH|nr:MULTISPECIES: hypothetical protein [Rhizobium]QFY60356.1 hypothetical protein FZ934_07870 [Rhizobium grahamii]QRM50518.1 hypothetical protein F3Y33_15020 [Rhizobium sp. BG6]